MANSDVTNQNIIDNLRQLGYNLPGPFDTRGAQNSEFKNRLIDALQPQLPAGQYAEDIFNHAKDVAQKLQVIPVDATVGARMTATLQAYGVDPHVTNQILEKASQLGGANFSDQDYDVAVAAILGNNNPVIKQAYTIQGRALPPTVGTAPFGSAADQAQAAPGMTQDPNAGQAGTRVPQLGQLPTPPPQTEAQHQASQAAAAAAATKAPGVPASPAPGASAPAAAGATTGANKLTPPFIPHSPQEIDDFIHQHFGADAWFMDIPEVSKILHDMAATGNTDGTEAARRVSATQWYHNTDEKQRNFTVLEGSDPGTAKKNIADQTDFLISQAAGMGITLDPLRAGAIADASLRYAWTPTQITSALGAEFHYDPSSKNQAAVVSSMKQAAANYMIPLSDDAIQQWGQGIESGKFTTDQFTEYVKGVSKSLYPQMASQIDAGNTMKTITDPYRQMAASTLEIAPDTIDFMDPAKPYGAALNQIDPKTGQRTMMSLTDWGQKLRTDPTYGYDKTSQAVGQAASLANTILQKFGKVA